MIKSLIFVSLLGLDGALENKNQLTEFDNNVPIIWNTSGSYSNLEPYNNFVTNTNIFTLSANSIPVITIKFDGTVLLSNTNLDEASKLFWNYVKESYPHHRLCGKCKTNIVE